MSSSKFKTIILIIIDGWGIALPSQGNATTSANLPFIRYLLNNFPNSKLLASGPAVGLLNNDPGNTEIGHLNIGAGRIIDAPITQIDRAITDGSFYSNQAFKNLIYHLKKYNGNLHLVGLFGSGHVHASNHHLSALLKLAKRAGIKNVYLHLFTDGRDSPPTAARSLLAKLERHLKNTGIGKIVTITGRFYAMDRDRRFERTKKAYQAFFGKAEVATTVAKAIDKSYKNGVTDEFIPPTIITNDDKPLGLITKNDGIIFFNHRGERAIQLTEFFTRELVSMNLFFVTMAEFDKNLHVSAVAFTPKPIKMTLGEVFSNNGLHQLRIAESEKSRFVTYYFNGYRKQSFPLEDRIIIPSPQVSTYDQKPEMSAFELTDELISQLNNNSYGFIVINFANPDMVGHTGLFKPTVIACEVIDRCLKKIIDVTLGNNLPVIITADHGNAEEKIDLKTGLSLTEHTNNPVPIMFVSQVLKDRKIHEGGILADIAPTILNLIGINIPTEMTGQNLLQ